VGRRDASWDMWTRAGGGTKEFFKSHILDKFPPIVVSFEELNAFECGRSNDRNMFGFENFTDEGHSKVAKNTSEQVGIR